MAVGEWGREGAGQVVGSGGGGLGGVDVIERPLQEVQQWNVLRSYGTLWPSECLSQQCEMMTYTNSEQTERNVGRGNSALCDITASVSVLPVKQ